MGEMKIESIETHFGSRRERQQQISSKNPPPKKEIATDLLKKDLLTHPKDNGSPNTSKEGSSN